MALVDEGSVRVGFPGAPGCTTTGACCCATTDSENKPGSIVATTIPLNNVATLITVRSLRLHSESENSISVEWSSIE